MGPRPKRPAAPARREPTRQPDGTKKPIASEARAYLNAVKEMFGDKREKYEEFVAVLRDFTAKRIDTTHLRSRVKELLKGHRDLILGFNIFLPEGHEITLPPENDPPKKPGEFKEEIHSLNKVKRRDERSSAVPTMRQTLADKRERTIISDADCDLSVDRPHPDDRGLGKADKEDKNGAEKERERKEDRNRRYPDRDGKDLDHDGNGDFIRTPRPPHRKKPPRRLDDSATEHGGEGAENLAIPPISVSSYGDKNALKIATADANYLRRHSTQEKENPNKKATERRMKKGRNEGPGNETHEKDVLNDGVKIQVDEGVESLVDDLDEGAESLVDNKVERKKIDLAKINFNQNLMDAVISTVEHHNTGQGYFRRKIYISDKEICKGSNGNLILEGLYMTRTHVAVKRLVKKNYVAPSEVKISLKSSTNIIKYFDMEQDQDYIYLAMERCMCNLDELILFYGGVHKINNTYLQKVNFQLWDSDGSLSKELIGIIRDIISGVAYLHENSEVHGELRPKNVLISFENLIHAKIYELRVLRHEDIGDDTGYESGGWSAPELIERKHTIYGPEQDVFSLGCVIYFCVSKGHHPFGLGEERIQNIIKNDWNKSVLGSSQEALDLFSLLFEPIMEKRLKAKATLRHPFFWHSEKKATFLHDVHDWYKGKRTPTKRSVESGLVDIQQEVFPTDWMLVMDTCLVSYLCGSPASGSASASEIKRNYNNQEIMDLLRAFRNIVSHRNDLSQDVKKVFGGDLRENIYNYFSRLFPRLLIEVYKVMYRVCKKEKTFSKYFLEEQ